MLTFERVLVLWWKICAMDCEIAASRARYVGEPSGDRDRRRWRLGPEEPVAEVAQAGEDVLAVVELAVEGGGVDDRVGHHLLRWATPSGAATIESRRTCARPRPRRPSTAIAAEPPVASMGSSRKTTARRGPSAPSRSSAARPPSPRCARARSSRPAAWGTSSRNASSMPRPARSTGTATTREAMRLRDACARAASRPRRPRGAQVAGGLDGQQQAHAAGQAAELVAGRRAVAQPRQRVLDQRMAHDVQRHGRAEDSTPERPAACYTRASMRLDADEIEYIARKIVKTLVAERQARGRLRAPLVEGIATVITEELIGRGPAERGGPRGAAPALLRDGALEHHLHRDVQDGQEEDGEGEGHHPVKLSRGEGPPPLPPHPRPPQPRRGGRVLRRPPGDPQRDRQASSRAR